MKHVNIHKTCCTKLAEALQNGTKLSLNPTCTGQGQSRPPQFWRQIPNKLPVLDFKIKNTFSCRNVFPIFFNFRQDIKNDVLTSILMYCQKSGLSTTLQTPPPPLLLSFTAITDPLGAGEVSLGCGPQSGVVPVNIPVSFWSWATLSSRGGGFSVAPALLLFLSGQLEPHRSWQIPETVLLYYTPSKYWGK